MTYQIFETTDRYIGELFPERDEALIATERSVEESRLEHNMSISPIQGRFLQVMARTCQAKKILEMGTFVGYSTIWMARALPPDGQLITLEADPIHAGIARKNFMDASLDKIIQLRVGKALELLPKIAMEGVAPFDMIFIDADKPTYPEYFQWALRLSRPGTLIMVDNVIRHVMGFTSNTSDDMTEGVKKFNQLLSESPAVVATIIQNVGIKEHDGMAIAVVK